MATIHLRNVPDDVVIDLEELARREGTSVSVVAIRELREAARRAKNAALLNSLPDLAIPTGSIVAALDIGRSER